MVGVVLDDRRANGAGRGWIAARFPVEKRRFWETAIESAVQKWNLLSIDAPNGTLDPIIVAEDDGARAVLLVLHPGQSLGDHQVRENAWVSVVEGSVRVSADGESTEVGPGGLLRFEPAERHSLSTESGARILLILTPWPAEGHFPAP